MNRYIFGALPRSTKLRPLVPEFAHSFLVIAPAQHVDNSADTLTGCTKGSKIISRRLWQWGNFRAEDHSGATCTFLGIEEKDLKDDCVIECFHIGVPHEPMEFLQWAIWAGHPKDLKRHVGDAMHEVILGNFHRPPHQLAKKRVDFIKKYTAIAKQLKPDELKLRLSMPPHIRKIMYGKRIALLGKMLADLDFPDTELVNDIARGFKLSGWMPDSNLFPRQVKAPKLTVDALKDSTASFNDKVSKQMQLRQDQVLEASTWEETEHELKEGWIWEDTSGDWTGKSVARRFGIHQGAKTRVIDDCTVNGLNLTVGTREKFALHSIDQLCGLLNHSFEISSERHCDVLGRTYDLRSAYKQFGLCEEDRNFLRIAVNRPGAEQPTLVGLNSLPFGAIGSVAGFLRVSFAVWWIGVFGLSLAWSAYFDDYSSLTRSELSSNTHWAIATLFEIIGLDYAKEGPKAPPFSPTFKMLGLVVDLAGATQKRFEVGHTQDRRLELMQCLDEIAEKKEISSKEAERVRGRMLFFECFVSGRTANFDLKQFSNLCRLGRTSSTLTEDEVLIVRRLRSRVESGSSIPMGVQSLSTWLIFTDGACEGDAPCGSVGGVLIAPNHRIVHHFGSQAPQNVMSFLLQFSRHPIHELEMIPVLVSFLLWGHLIQGAQVVHYIDNESVRLALLRGSGETKVAQAVAKHVMDAEFSFGTRSWYARVASHSNIADPPSRGCFDVLESLDSVHCAVDWEQVLASCSP
eukprot:s702_g43.t2